MKKLVLIVMAGLLTGLFGFNDVKADSDTFQLTMGTVEYFRTKTKRYVEGTFFVDMSFDRWYNPSCTSGQFGVSLYQSGTERALGSVQKNIYMYSSYLHKFGYFNSIEKYYEFHRLSCGWVSNKVTVGS